MAGRWPADGDTLTGTAAVLTHRYLAAVLLAVLFVFPVFGGVIYVDAKAKGTGTGADWANAFPSLAAALNQSPAGSEIWAAEGVYIPGDKRSDSFVLKPNMKLYGGFTSSMKAIQERDPAAHATILSGEIQNKGDRGGSPTDNSYYVVRGAAGALLDGVTVRDGGDVDYVNGRDLPEQGKVGGMLVENAGADAQTIANCIFLANEAYYDGFQQQEMAGYGGAIFAINSSIKVADCTFDKNRACTGGGAIAVMNPKDARSLKVEIRNCVFRTNHMRLGDGEAGGGALWIGAGDVLIEKCKFFDGRAGINIFVNGCGAAVCLPSGYTGACRIVDSVFGSNATTLGRGGGMYVGRDATIEKCVFSANSVERGSGGGLYVNEGAKVTVNDSVFAGNYASSAPRDGDLASGSGGGIASNGALVARNCVIAGNAALGTTQERGGGGGFCQLAGVGGSVLRNCVISGNEAVYGGGIFVAADLAKPVDLTESVVRENNVNTKAGTGPPQMVGSSLVVSKSNVEGGWPGTENRDEALAATQFPAGKWTAVTYDPVTGQTTLTDDSAKWTPGALAGLCVLPNTTHRERVIETRGAGSTNITTMRTLQFMIESNTATSIKVWGNARSIRFWDQTPDVAGVGRGYKILNYRSAKK